MNLSRVPACAGQTCLVLLVLGWNPAVKNIPVEVHYRPSEHVYEKTQCYHACFSACWPFSVAKACVWCSSAQYLFWCSWCHRLKSMLNATMLPETMPVIKVLWKKRNKDSNIIPQLPQEDSVEETGPWMFVKMCVVVTKKQEVIRAATVKYQIPLSVETDHWNHLKYVRKAADFRGSSCTVGPRGLQCWIHNEQLRQNGLSRVHLCYL